MVEEGKWIHNYKATSEAADLDDGIQFQVEDRMRSFQEDGSQIEVSFASGMKRTLHFVRTTSDPKGYVVAVKRPDGGNVHLTIVEIAPRKFRVVLPDHLRSESLR